MSSWAFRVDAGGPTGADGEEYDEEGEGEAVPDGWRRRRLRVAGCRKRKNETRKTKNQNQIQTQYKIREINEHVAYFLLISEMIYYSCSYLFCYSFAFDVFRFASCGFFGCLSFL